MRKVILTYGLIAGAVMGVSMSIIVGLMHNTVSFEYGMVIGYTTMIIAFSLIYFGVKNYRENIGNGTISFGRAISLGLLMTLIGAVIYSIAWMLLQHFFIPDFYEKYMAHQAEVLKASNPAPAELAAGKAQMESMREMFKSPVVIFFTTILEPLPVGILISLIASLILKKKPEIAVQ